MAIVRNTIKFSSGGGSDIIVVANYSALPDPTTVSGQFYWCSASQGTSWLPGSLGGTYYNSGMYYSNGTTWEFINVPYQATQAEVNTGTNTDKFVTPSTLKNQNYLATIAYADAKVEDAIVNGVTTKAPSQNAVFDALALKADLTQVGNLLREEFTFSGSQTFTLANNYGQVYSVEVQGQGALSTSQYTLVAPNQITINDTLDSGDYVVIIYSNAIVGIQPYYSQAEVDALLNLKANSNQTAKTWKSGIDGVTVANTLTITPTYTQLIPGGTFTSGDVVELLFRSTSPSAKTSVSSQYIYINTTDNLSGTPLQLAIYTSGPTTRTIQMGRALAIKGSTTRLISTSGNLSTDNGQSASMSLVSIDWTIDQYFIFAIGHTVADQTLTGDFYRIIKN